MKKLISLFLNVIMISAILAGCSAGQPNQSEVAHEESVPTSNTEASSQIGSTVEESNIAGGIPTERVTASAVNVIEIAPEVPNEAYAYSDGMGLFNYNSKVGYLDSDGKIVVDAKYKNGTRFDEGVAIVEKVEGGLSTINSKGEETASFDAYKLMNSSSQISDGILMVVSTDNSSYACIDTKGNVLFEIEERYQRGGMFSEGILMCTAEGISPVVFGVDITGKKVIADIKTGLGANEVPNLQFKDGLLALPNFDKTWNVIDKTGAKQFAEDFEKLKQPSEGLIPFMKYGKWGYIDYNGAVVIETQYENAYSFSNGLAAVQIDGKIGYIDGKNNIVIEPKFQMEPQINTLFPRLFKFNEDKLALVPDGDGSLIDMHGAVVLSAPGKSNIFYYGDSMICYVIQNKSYLYKISS